MLELRTAIKDNKKTVYFATNSDSEVSIIRRVDNVVAVHIHGKENLFMEFDNFNEAVRWAETKVCMTFKVN